MLGFCVVVYLAGLQGIPQELIEAAELDQAGTVRRFRHVVWPLLVPRLVTLIVTASPSPAGWTVAIDA